MSTKKTRDNLTVQAKPRADGVRNRQRILAAAVDLFNSRGISVSLEEIAQNANVGMGTVYRHFPNKQSLFESVVQQSIQALTDAARLLGEREDAGGALVEFMVLVGHSAKLKRTLIQALTLLGENVAHDLRETLEEFDAQFHNLVIRAQKKGDIRHDITTADIRALMAGCMLAQDRNPATSNIRKLILIVYDGIRI